MTRRGPDKVGAGYLLGLLAGEGHFGGDGRQPHVTLRMHVRHEKLFRWLEATFPEGRLYGPYHHGGRDYFQWMARGEFLRERLVPLGRGNSCQRTRRRSSHSSPTPHPSIS